MKTHELKILPGYFEDVATGRKMFEVRRDDGRGFALGDELFLSEWRPGSFDVVDGGHYTGRAIRAFVSYVLDLHDVPRFPDVGDEGAWVVLGLANVAPARRQTP